MMQKLRNENARVVCLFCGASTYVPASRARDAHNEIDFGPGITLVRCHVCCKEAPYSANEIFSTQDISRSNSNARAGAAGL